MLIVQSDALNASLADAIVALITSRVHRDRDTHVLVDPVTPEGRHAGLRLLSAVQCENLYTIDQKLVLRVIGKLDSAGMVEVNECLKRSLALK